MQFFPLPIHSLVLKEHLLGLNPTNPSSPRNLLFLDKIEIKRHLQIVFVLVNHKYRKD